MIEFDSIESLAEWALHAVKLGLVYKAEQRGDCWFVTVTGF